LVAPEGQLEMLTAADKIGIIELVQRADDAATRRDYDGYVDLYIENGVMEGSQGNYTGKAAIREATEAVWGREPAGSVHLTQNLTVTAHSWLLIVAPNDPRQIVAIADITQVVEETANGWRVVRRTIAEP
jgi:ketosteroid isomerase-like protein